CRPPDLRLDVRLKGLRQSGRKKTQYGNRGGRASARGEREETCAHPFQREVQEDRRTPERGQEGIQGHGSGTRRPDLGRPTFQWAVNQSISSSDRSHSISTAMDPSGDSISLVQRAITPAKAACLLKSMFTLPPVRCLRIRRLAASRTCLSRSWSCTR